MKRKPNSIFYVGVVGQIAAGKGVLVDYLTKKLGFISFSLSSILHKDLEKKGKKQFTRKTLQDVGDSLRKQFGDDVLAKRALMKLQVSEGKSKLIIEGIRNPGEIKFLKKNSDFILIGVKADRKIRFKRLLSRNKPWDPKTWNDFVKVDRRDLGIGQGKSGQQVKKCLAYCDYILTNNSSVRDFEDKVKKLMKKILSQL